MKSLALVIAVVSAVVLLPAGVARAANPPGPPPGWEEAPPLPVKATVKSSKPKLAACCGYNPLCCSRQTDIDTAQSDRVARAVEVRVANLPESAVKKAPKDHPGIAGVPPVRAIDGRGQPWPWDSGPASEIRVMPPGRFGEIFWREQWGEPFFANPKLRSLGYGMVRSVGKTDDKGRSELTGSVSYTALDKGSGDTIAVDLVTGALDGTPEVVATRWLHVEAAPVAVGVLYAYRGKRFYRRARGPAFVGIPRTRPRLRRSAIPRTRRPSPSSCPRSSWASRRGTRRPTEGSFRAASRGAWPTRRTRCLSPPGAAGS